jgi:hypothetical protein
LYFNSDFWDTRLVGQCTNWIRKTENYWKGEMGSRKKSCWDLTKSNKIVKSIKHVILY